MIATNQFVLTGAYAFVSKTLNCISNCINSPADCILHVLYLVVQIFLHLLKLQLDNV